MSLIDFMLFFFKLGVNLCLQYSIIPKYFQEKIIQHNAIIHIYS